MSNQPRYSAEDVLVVVRSSGERTLPALLEELQKQVPSQNLHVVEKNPFFEAVKEMFRIGIAHPHPLLLAVDGDVLLADYALEFVTQIAGDFDPTQTLRFYFLVRDKFVGPRTAGNHIYFNRWSEKCLEYFEDRGDPLLFRPESANISAFAESQGLEWNSWLYKHIGWHGFGQYYKHIYCGMYNFAVKSSKDKAQLVEAFRYLADKHEDDLDFQIALDGIEQGAAAKQVITDFDHYPEITYLLEQHGVAEKESLTAEALMSELHAELPELT